MLSRVLNLLKFPLQDNAGTSGHLSGWGFWGLEVLQAQATNTLRLRSGLRL